MFGAKKVNNTITSTVIGDGIQINGAMLRGTGGVRIDGEYVGDIEINGNIIIGETGIVKGNIRVSHALVAGKVEGNISCTSGVHLATTAKLYGNIDATALIIDEGAIFSGNCRMDGLQPNTGEKSESDKVELIYGEQVTEVV